MPVLKLDGQIFYQTEAIVEWAASKAGVQTDDPVERMQVKMIEETIKEVLMKSVQDRDCLLIFHILNFATIYRVQRNPL